MKDEDSSPSEEEDSEQEELVKELEALEADNLYHDFGSDAVFDSQDEHSGYKSDEDPDFQPVLCSKCGNQIEDGIQTGIDNEVQTECQDCQAEIPIDSDDTDSSSTPSSEAESDDGGNLVEMAEEQDLPTNDDNLDNVDQEQFNDLFRQITGHDDADYNSDEDPDYVPPNDVADDSDDKMQE